MSENVNAKITITAQDDASPVLRRLQRQLERLRKMLDERGLTSHDIEVDGGIHEETISRAVSAGANMLVFIAVSAGTAVE